MDTYNIGSIFRLADSVAAEKIILCGETEAPPHTRIKKASINTTEWVNWEYAETAASAISNLKSQISNIQIVAVEQDTKSVQYDKVDYTFPVALVVGHETHGVSKSALQLCDNIAEIPMWGVNVSLNVVVSLGIVLFKVMEKI
jgi:tRNA G18 (ribose-2'-O)-methylase SpoU